MSVPVDFLPDFARNGSQYSHFFMLPKKKNESGSAYIKVQS
jgi:hypothetical protein